MRIDRSVRRIVGTFVVAIGSVALLAWTSAFVDFGLAIMAAGCWCIWLEHHPST